MKEKTRIIIITIVMFIAQLLASYYSFIEITMENPLLKVLTILCINYVLVVIGIVFAFKDYRHMYGGITDLYAKYRINTILYNLLKALAKVDETEDIYGLILDAAISAIASAKYGTIIMSNYGKMTFKAALGFDLDYLSLVEVNMQDTALYKLSNGKMDKPMIIHDIMEVSSKSIGISKADLLNNAGAKKIKTTLTAPIIINGSVVGSINLDTDQAYAFTDQDIETLDLFALEVGKFVHLNQILELNRNMSRYDELTQIFNRGYSKKIIKEMITKKKSFILVSCDLNNLKTINDLYGHDIGDKLITGFVNNMKLFLPDDTLFARYGGDEFVLVFKDKLWVEAKVIMEDASAFFANYVFNDTEYPISVSFSYGLVEVPRETDDYDTVLKLADERMYNHKREYKASH